MTARDYRPWVLRCIVLEDVIASELGMGQTRSGEYLEYIQLVPTAVRKKNGWKGNEEREEERAAMSVSLRKLPSRGQERERERAYGYYAGV